MNKTNTLVVILIVLVILLIVLATVFGAWGPRTAYIVRPVPVTPGGEYVPPSQGGGSGPVMCTMEAKLCPDGSYVGRGGPNCEFSACPGPVTQ